MSDASVLDDVLLMPSESRKALISIVKSHLAGKKVRSGALAEGLSSVIDANKSKLGAVYLYNKLCCCGFSSYIGCKVETTDFQQLNIPATVLIAGRTIQRVDAFALEDTCFVQYEADDEDELADGGVDLPSAFFTRNQWILSGAFKTEALTAPATAQSMSTLCELNEGLVYGIAEQFFRVPLPDGHSATFSVDMLHILHPDGMRRWPQQSEAGLPVEGVSIWKGGLDAPAAQATVADLLEHVSIANFIIEDDALIIKLENITNTDFAKAVRAGDYANSTDFPVSPGPEPFVPSSTARVEKIKVLPLPEKHNRTGKRGRRSSTNRSSGRAAAITDDQLPSASDPKRPRQQNEVAVEMGNTVDPNTVIDKLFAVAGVFKALQQHSILLKEEQKVQLEAVAVGLEPDVTRVADFSRSLCREIESNCKQQLDVIKHQQGMINSMPLLTDIATQDLITPALDAAKAALGTFASADSKSGLSSINDIKQLAAEINNIKGLKTYSIAQQAATQVLEKLAAASKEINQQIHDSVAALNICVAGGFHIEHMPDLTAKKPAAAALKSLEEAVKSKDGDVAQLVACVARADLCVKQLATLRDQIREKRRREQLRIETILKAVQM